MLKMAKITLKIHYKQNNYITQVIYGKVKQMFISFKTLSMVYSLVVGFCLTIEIFDHQNGFNLSLHVVIACHFDC
jgi:hypothetical protein